MNQTIKRTAKEFHLYWKNYVFQSLFATLAIFIVLLALKDMVVIAVIGATTFLVFAMPKSITVQPRNIIGGYLVGLACGCLLSLVPHSGFFSGHLGCSLLFATAVGLSIFIMVVTDTEHPPASGIALAAAIDGFSLKLTIAVVVSAFLLSAIHIILKKFLKDLT